jgi:hypothetical protein
LIAALETHFKVDNVIHFDQLEQHIPYVTHILNLTVYSFLHNLKVLEDDSTSTSDDEVELNNIFSDPEKDFVM